MLRFFKRRRVALTPDTYEMLSGLARDAEVGISDLAEELIRLGVVFVDRIIKEEETETYKN